MGNCPVCSKVSARPPVWPYCSRACAELDKETIRAFAKRIEERVAKWPGWKHRAARAGLFTEETR